MGTRAVYSFIDKTDKRHVYKHWDGYPTGAATFIANALPYAWPLPRFEPDEFAGAFVAGNKKLGEGFSQGGDIRLIAASNSTPCNKAAKAAACDIAYRYEISVDKKGALQVRAFTTSYWDAIVEEQIFNGSLEAFTEWANHEVDMLRA